MVGEKLDKAVVLYMTPGELQAKGACCGTCALIVKGTADCAILLNPKVSLGHGVCALYVGGPASQLTQIAKLSRQTAGYLQSPQVPTHCGNCEYWGGGDKLQGPCQVVEGTVDFWGCCNHWER